MQEDRFRGLEAELEALTQRVQALEVQRRVGTFGEPPAESAIPPAPEAEAAAVNAGELASSTDTRSEASRTGHLLPLIGRTLLVLGGGFLLRAATGSGTIPELTGAVLGLLYGLSFLGFAYRAAGRWETWTSAQFHAFSTAMIIFPLLWEATVQKGYLPVPVGGVALAISVGCALLVAWRKGLRPMAWIFASVGGLMAFAMGWTTHLWVPLVGLFLLICWATLLLFYSRGWSVLAGMGALTADAVVLFLGTLFVMQAESPFLEGLTLSTLLVLQLLLVLSYMGSFIVRTLVKGEEISVLGAAQGAAVLTIGVGLALVMGRDHPTLPRLMGWMALIGASLCYAVSFLFIDRQASRRRNFIFYTSIALALMVVMAVTLSSGVARTWLLLAASLITAFLAMRRQRITLLLHATLFATTAAFSTGLIAVSFDALAGDAVQLEFSHLLPSIAVLAVLFICASLQVDAHQGTWGPLVRVPRAICLILLVIGGSGIVATLGEGLMGGNEAADMAWVASLRTGVLSCFAILMAWMAGRPRYREAAWLVYPVLVFAGLALALGDFRMGRPVTMFVSLAFYGGALILSPMLLKRARTP